MAANGGAAQLYRLPTLAPWPTSLRGKLPAVERVLGVDPEGAELFVYPGDQHLFADSSLDEIAAQISNVDLILTEGYKREARRRIEVSRRALATELIMAEIEHIIKHVRLG